MSPLAWALAHAFFLRPGNEPDLPGGLQTAYAAIAEAAPGLDNLVMTIAPFTLILGAFAIAAVGTAFTVGDRLQRDTEGLV